MKLVNHHGSDVEFAKQDPALALLSIFRPICRGRRPGGFSIETIYDDTHVKYNIWQALDSRDQSVLLSILGLTGMLANEVSWLGSNVSNEQGQQLWLDLEPSDTAKLQKAVVVKTTKYALLQACGYNDSGKSYELLKSSLERLSMVGMRARKAGHEWSMRLLSYAVTPEGVIHIALNPRFADSLLGHHVNVSLIERRLLHSEVAQIAHAWLSAWLRQGSANKIGIDRLTEKIWGTQTVSDSTNRKRRERTIKALNEISELGWNIKLKGRGASTVAEIKRPRVIEA